MAYDNITPIDLLIHNTDYGGYASIVKIDATHFIIAYSGYGTDGYLSTFVMDADGDNITEIDQLEFDGSYGTYNSLVMLDSTHFAVAYRGNLNGRIKIVSIDGSYDNITVVGDLIHDSTVSCTHNSLVAIDSTHLILAYYDVTLGDGIIKTFSIDGGYNITEIDKLTHDTVKGEYNSLVMINSTHFILAYSGEGGDGYMATFSIDGSYDNIAEIDSMEHNISYGQYNSLVMIDSTHFILAYSGLGTDGYITTFSIDGSYDNITAIESLEHDTANGGYNSLKMIDSTHFILAYAGLDNDGYIRTFSIDINYENITVIETLEHDNDNGLFNSLAEMIPGLYALAYAGTGNDAYVMTFSVDIATITFDQEGYRFRNDDGSESAATWKAAQDIDVSQEKNETIRIRILTDTSAKGDDNLLRLQYKRTDEASSEWRDV